MPALLFLGAVSCAVSSAQFELHRPSAASWKRTPCGSSTAAIAGGDMHHGVDYPFSPLEPGFCGRAGCPLAAGSTHAACEGLCGGTTGCAVWIFAAANQTGCSAPGSVAPRVPTCWMKKTVGSARANNCTVSRVVGLPARPASEIPTRWATEVSADATPLPLYPRPQMVRVSPGSTVPSSASATARLRDEGDNATWTNLNGLWEWEPAGPGDTPSNPPFGQRLRRSILVPFPAESCLSGVAPRSASDVATTMWYRLTFDAARAAAVAGEGTLLHFGGVDWRTHVYLNGKPLGNHTGGYDAFDFNLTGLLAPTDNELLVHVYDPSDLGPQPRGKQRIAAVDWPGGGTYTPSSGIWQTVWLEHGLPAAGHIDSLSIDQASTSALTVTAHLNSAADIDVSFTVIDPANGATVATQTGKAGAAVRIAIDGGPALWSPDRPNLYDLTVTICHTPHAASAAGAVDGAATDTVLAYFGLRTFELGNAPAGKRPLLNGGYVYLAGLLDQSWWPDGLYTAPTDTALASDLEAVGSFGMNTLRLHQKVNPQRWYYHADRLGVMVLQDVPQFYDHVPLAHPTNDTVALFLGDMAAVIRTTSGHPCVLQYAPFNEGDCWDLFNVPDVVALARELDPTRLIDAISGGVNQRTPNADLGDVTDKHTYPAPGDLNGTATQYALLGEYGGIGAIVKGKEWRVGGCHSYGEEPTPAAQAVAFTAMAASLQSKVGHLSGAILTQITDIESECDGFLNYDRSSKFSAAQLASVKLATRAVIAAAAKLGGDAAA